MKRHPRSKQVDNLNLGPILKQARLDADLTQEEVAARVGIEPKYLSQLENGHGLPALQKLSQLIRVLKIDARFIFDPGLKAEPKKEIAKITDLLSGLSEPALTKVRIVLSAILKSFLT